MPQSIPASGISFLLVQSQFRLLEANSILSRGFPLNEPLPILIAKYLWVVLWLYWLVSARKLKAVKKRESWQERLQHMLPLIAAYFLLFSTRVHFGWLNERFVSDTQAVGWTGVSLTAAKRECFCPGSPERSCSRPLQRAGLFGPLGTC